MTFMLDAVRGAGTPLSIAAAASAIVFGLVASPRSPADTPSHICVQQASRSPTAGDILEASLVARGGRDAMAKVSSLQWFGTVNVPDSGVSGRFESLSARPARERFKLIWQGDFYTMDVNSDGTVMEQFPGDEHAVTGSERDQELLDAQFDYDTNWRELFPDVQLRGTTRFGGQLAYKIEMHSRDGLLRIRYISVDSMMPLGEDRDLVISERHRDSSQPISGRDHFTVRMVYSDWRTVNGVKYAYHWVRLATGHPNLPEMAYQTDRLVANEAWQ